jgi:hypothetical protein
MLHPPVKPNMGVTRTEEASALGMVTLEASDRMQVPAPTDVATPHNRPEAVHLHGHIAEAVAYLHPPEVPRPARASSPAFKHSWKLPP